MLKRISSLLFGDFRLISRDPMLYVLFAAPVMTVLIIRFGMPVVSSLLVQHLQFNLLPFLPFINTFLALIQAMLAGMLFGFIALDERDEGVIAAISVTPVARSGYIYYRLVIAALFSMLFFSIVMAGGGYVQLSFFRMSLMTLIASVNGAFYLLFLASTADNKVEGLALSKLGGLVFFAPIAGFFLPPVWRFPMMVFPTYWVVPVLTASDRSLLLFIPLMGLVFVAWFSLLFRWFGKKVLL